MCLFLGGRPQRLCVGFSYYWGSKQQVCDRHFHNTLVMGYQGMKWMETGSRWSSCELTEISCRNSLWPHLCWAIDNNQDLTQRARTWHFWSPVLRRSGQRETGLAGWVPVLHSPHGLGVVSLWKKAPEAPTWIPTPVRNQLPLGCLCPRWVSESSSWDLWEAGAFRQPSGSRIHSRLSCWAPELVHRDLNPHEPHS